MKKIGKLKLINVGKERLDEKQMSNLRGGSDCNCSCGCSCGCTCSCTGGEMSNTNSTLHGLYSMSSDSSKNLIGSSNVTIPFNYGGYY